MERGDVGLAGLVAARRVLRVRQADVARKLGVATSAVCAKERAQVAVDPDFVKRYAGALAALVGELEPEA